MACIFFDLDGTLVNSQQRLYELFRELCPECAMSYGEYWAIKRGRMSQKDMLQEYYGYNDAQVRAFHELWFAKVEEPARVDRDEPVPGMDVVLRDCAQRHTLFVASNRQNGPLAEAELSRLGWRDLFSAILITGQKRSKEELIRDCCTVAPEDVLVGDTGEDIRTARSLGIRSIAVSWGILERSILAEYAPDILLDDVSQLLTCGLLQGVCL